MKQFYSTVVMPRLLDRVMGGESFAQRRRSLLSAAAGEVLEIGFGTGLNLPFYDRDRVASLAAIDPNGGMNRLARRRLAAAPFPVELRPLGGEALPYGDRTFDCVVSTWTLCSIREVETAIDEVWRVLKPGGTFLFIEHGRSPDPAIARWQDRLNPIQKRIGDGCHLNRNIAAIVQKRFPDAAIAAAYAPEFPKIGGYFYEGQALKPPTP
ncbi:MAG: class I SAM-dependent methyltransferase [Cyanobacteria bacterium]|nr:class I SAM-dependent methyltransferase [Cyanobacteriota bacterium]